MAKERILKRSAAVPAAADRKPRERSPRFHRFFASSELRLTPIPRNNRHISQTVGPRCCAAIKPGGAAAPPYPLHRLSLGIGIRRSTLEAKKRWNRGERSRGFRSPAAGTAALRFNIRSLAIHPQVAPRVKGRISIFVRVAIWLSLTPR